MTTVCTGTNGCDNEFFFCLRPLGAAPLSTTLVSNYTGENSVTARARNLGCLESPPALRSSEVDFNGNLDDFASPTFLGLPNPIEFSVMATKWEVSVLQYTNS